MGIQEAFKGFRPTVSNEAASLVRATVAFPRSVSADYLPLVTGHKIDADTSGIDSVSVPTITWDQIDIDAAIPYFNAVVASILAKPTERHVAFQDPGELDITIDPPTLDTELYEALRDSLTADITNGGYGLDNGIEEDVFNQERDKVVMEASIAKTALCGRMAGSGLPYAPGAMLGGLHLLNTAAASKLEEANSAIIKSRFETHLDGKTSSLEQGVALSRSQLDTFALNIKLLARVYVAKIDAYLQKTKTKAQFALAELEAYDAKVKGYAGRMRALATLWRAVATNDEYVYRVYDNELSAAFSETDAKLDQEIAEAKAKAEEARALIAAYASIASAALSSLNVNASMSESYSASESNSANSSASDSASASASDSASVTVRVSTDTGEKPNPNLPD